MKKKLLYVCITILALLGLGYGLLQSKTYQPSQVALKASQKDQVLPSHQGLLFKAQGKKHQTTIVFCPGGLVAPKSYAPWIKRVSQAGYDVYLAYFPLNLAVLSSNKAQKISHNQKLKQFVLGGHSLGGAMASRYATNHSQQIKGIFFLASYPDQKGSLRKLNIPALSITAGHDKVLNWKKYRHNKIYLPRQTSFVTLDGGNHSGFGSYGHQKGDGKATISSKQQNKLVAQTIISWLQKHFN